MHDKLMDQLMTNDTLVDLASLIEQRGARYVVELFRSTYPSHARELELFFMGRDKRPVAALLKE